jgi:ribosome-associated protein
MSAAFFHFTSEIRDVRPVLRKVSLSDTRITTACICLRESGAHRENHPGQASSRLLPYDANPLPEGANAMPNLDFTLTGDYVELHNLLKISGLAESGGQAKMMVADGAVTVDGRVETRKTCKIRAGQVVLLGDTRIAVHEA